MMTRQKVDLSGSLLLALLVVVSPEAQAQSPSTSGAPAAPNVAPAHRLGVVAKIARKLEASRPAAPDSLLDQSPFAPKSADRNIAPRRASATAGPGAGVPAVISGGRNSKFAGWRDPFRLPPPPAAGAAGMELRRPPLPGKRGLMIGQLKLLGIVRQHALNSADAAQATMIAVVTNASQVAYFLRTGDALYDGRITRITADAAYFDQEYLDPEGQARRREVVKRLNAGSGEEQP